MQNDPVNFVDPLGLDPSDILGPPPPVPTLIPYGGTIVTNTSASRPSSGSVGTTFGDDNFGLENGPTEEDPGGDISGPNPLPDPQNPAPSPVTQGIDQARQALQENALCRALFGGTNPLTLLNTYSSNNLITAGTSYPVAQRGGGTRNRNFGSADVGAVTSYAAGSYPHPTVAGLRISANPITINQNGFYFSGRNSSGVAVSTIQGAGFYGLSLGQLRGAVILHELLHVVSRIPSDSGNPRQSRASSELVRRFCFSNTPVSTTTTPITTLP